MCFVPFNEEIACQSHSVWTPSARRGGSELHELHLSEIKFRLNWFGNWQNLEYWCQFASDISMSEKSRNENQIKNRNDSVTSQMKSLIEIFERMANVYEYLHLQYLYTFTRHPTVNRSECHCRNNTQTFRFHSTIRFHPLLEPMQIWII